MRHQLKLWPEYFKAVATGTRTFEVRENDRNFKVGDVLELREWIPQQNDPECEIHYYLMGDGNCTCGTKGKYTGRRLEFRVTYMTDFGQPDNQVVMAIIPNMHKNQWQLIETAPLDSTVIDIWSASEGRLTNYRRVKLSKDNIFYDPDESGACCIRDATHWMSIPNPPNAKERI